MIAAFLGGRVTMIGWDAYLLSTGKGVGISSRTDPRVQPDNQRNYSFAERAFYMILVLQAKNTL